ncbi:putative transposase [Citreicella sp. 357]|nr:putative transposase [Citreicella sp. 357]
MGNLSELKATRPYQVWAMGITCIPLSADLPCKSPAGQWMARGFICLAAVLDWFTRRVLAWRVSITLEAGFCIEAVAEALARPGAPEIFDTDQGSQFTSTDVIKVLASRKIRISMDAKGARRANVFVERLWRTIKYEDVRLQACASVSHARAGIGRHPGICNSRRPHASLDGKTPDQAYFSPPMPEARRHNRGGNPLANARSLFRQPEPLLFSALGRAEIVEIAWTQVGRGAITPNSDLCNIARNA